jgi:phosphoglycolate phosphatase-like HAD superfamily hydrolase
MRGEKVRAKAILFDLDGTIFDVAERYLFARYEALCQLGYDVSLNEVRRRYRYGIGRMGIVKDLGITLSKKDTIEYLKARSASFTKRENALKLTRIHKGAYDVLFSLSDKYRLVLVTSRGPLSSTEEELDWFKIRRFFSLTVTREVAAKYHGVEDIPLFPFREQRKKLYECVTGLTKIGPEDMLFIGDSVGELEPAKELRIRTIGVLTGIGSREEMESASIFTIRDISQLVEILG